MIHDYCYGDTRCRMQKLIYFIPYKWKCNGGYPYCGKFTDQIESIGIRMQFNPLSTKNWLALCYANVCEI